MIRVFSMPENPPILRITTTEKRQIRLGIATLQHQYEGQVIALVVQELAVVAPALGEDAVMELVATVWEQAASHQSAGAATTWSHLSWFVQHSVATRRQGLRTLPLRHAVVCRSVNYRMAG